MEKSLSAIKPPGGKSDVRGPHQPRAAEFRHPAKRRAMSIKSIFSGRMEKRIPIAIVVRLTPAQDQPAREPELTYTDNVSAHGVRVVSSRSWQIGDVAQVTSLKDEIAISGKVAYCQMLPDNRYFIGLNFQDRRVTWSAYRAYNGT